MAKAATKKPATKTTVAKASARRPWTKDDLRTLKTQARQKITAPKIAKALKRTEGATRQKAFSEGISLDSR
jgi:hypothetical protein